MSQGGVEPDDDAAALLTSLEETVPRLRGADGGEVLRDLDARYPDLLAAADELRHLGRADEALRFGTALVPFWMATKRLAEGSDWFDAALADGGASDRARARALYDDGYLAFWQGRSGRSTQRFSEAVELAREVGDPSVAALALTGLARLALSNDVEEARRLCREALAEVEGTDDRRGRSNARHVLGVAAQMAGDLDEARGHMTARLEEARAAGDLATVTSEAANLSMVERQLGELDAAQALIREALTVSEQRGDELMVAWVLNGVAAVTAARGDAERAATILGAADALLQAQDGRWPPDEAVQFAETTRACEAALGAQGFALARDAGATLSSTAAVDVALERAAGPT